ncbi:MAG: DUF58 domain-containing protein [Desulfobacterium sp.]|nr:DUF58 domain-containing protein [Desulfobacterium sp.]
MKLFLYKSYNAFYSSSIWRKRRFTSAGSLVLVTIFITAGLGLDTGQSLIYQIFSFLLPLLIFAMIFSFSFRIQFEIDRKLPSVATVGEPLTYDIRIHNLTGRKQKGLYFYDNPEDPRPSFQTFITAREPGEEKRNIWDRKVLFHRWIWLIERNTKVRIKESPIPELLPNAEGRVSVNTIPRQRGYLWLTGITITRPEPLGLCKSFHVIPNRQKILVLPKRYKIPDILLEGTRKYHSGGISMASSVGDSNEFLSLRQYRPGDPMKQIHWKSWAKTNELIIREHQDEFFVRHALILDTFQKEFYSDVFEEAVSIAASMVCTFQTRESILDLMFVGAEIYCFSSGRSMAQTGKMLEILSCVQTCSDKNIESLQSLVKQSAGLLSGCICILLSWDQERKNFIQNLLSHGLPLVVIVVTKDDPGSIQQDPGPMKNMIHRFHAVQVGDIEKGLASL